MPSPNYARVPQSDLAVSLTAPDQEDLAKPASSTPMVEIVAPATLCEGFELETRLGEQLLKVKIPPGGVAKGQRFSVPLPNGAESALPKPRYQVPVGVWKDGLFECCKYGICHATCCWGFVGILLYPVVSNCCLFWTWPALGATQVATRMNLDWLGRPVQNNNLQRGQFSAWSKFGLITIGYVLLLTLLWTTIVFIMGKIWTVESVQEEQEDIWLAEHFLYVIRMATIVYLVLCVFIIYRIRGQVRKSYSIPVNDCCPNAACEDCCAATFCGCCAASQMMRHTGDYENYPAQCCSSTGFPAWAEARIV